METEEKDGKAPAFSRPLIGGALALFLVFGAYLCKGLPVGVPGEWWLEYRSSFPSAWSLVSLAAAMTALVAAAALFDRAWPSVNGRRRALAVASCTILYFILLFYSARCGPQGPAEFVAPAFKSDASGLFQDEAAGIENAREYLSRFPQTMARYADNYRDTVRVNNNPPGATMLFYAAFRIAKAAPGVGMLAGEAVFGLGFEPPDARFGGTVLASWALLLGAALAFIPAWLVARILTGGPGLLVAAVCGLAASMVLFVPGKDTLQLLFFLWMLYFFLLGRGARPVIWGAALGLAAAIAFFFTLATAVVVVVFFVSDIWLAVGRPERRLRGRSLFWLSAAAGLLAGFAVLYLALGYNSLASLLACYHNHTAFYEHFPRTYWKWLFFNPFEFTMFLGAGLAAAAVGAAALRNPFPQDPSRHDSDNRIYLFSALVVMAALNLSGKNASEAARLWVFFMPLVALPACALMRRARHGFNNLLAVAAIQAASVVILRTYLDVWRVEDLFKEIGALP